MSSAELNNQRLKTIMTVMACLLVFKVTIGVVLTYGDYVPANFKVEFLNGRQSYFWDGYHWAFYIHIMASPLTLLIGPFLLSERFRNRHLTVHRQLGRTQATLVILFVTPSGLWMAFYADAGPIAAAGFATLAIATGIAMTCAWRAATGRRFIEHRNWAWRCYLLLCSAVILRLTAGLAQVCGIEGEWTYQFAAWNSWVMPVVVFEVLQRKRKRRSAAKKPRTMIGSI